MGNSKDNDFSSITALLKALHCGDLLRVIALLFIIVNSMGIYRRYITSPGLKMSLSRTLAPLSPAHSCRWGTVATNDWCIKHCFLSLRNYKINYFSKFYACPNTSGVPKLREKNMVLHLASERFVVATAQDFLLCIICLCFQMYLQVW